MRTPLADGSTPIHGFVIKTSPPILRLRGECDAISEALVMGMPLVHGDSPLGTVGDAVGVAVCVGPKSKGVVVRVGVCVGVRVAVEPAAGVTGVEVGTGVTIPEDTCFQYWRMLAKA